MRTKLLYLALTFNCLGFAQGQENVISIVPSLEYFSLSDDGKIGVFHSNMTGNNEIYKIHLETKELTQLTFNQHNDRTPSISPDGKKVVFVSTRDGNYDVFLMNIDGGSKRNLTNDSISKDIHPYWHPNGERIIFNSTGRGQDYEIITMNAQGGDQKKVRNKSGEATHAQFSPNGRKIAFRRFNQASPKYNSDIWLLEIETKREYSVTNGVEFDNHPTWDKKGNTIVFSSIRKGKHSLFSYNLKTKRISRITNPENGAKDKLPFFSRSEDTLFFTRKFADGTSKIMSLNQFPLDKTD